MTAIKPAETRLVRGVASERYPSNKTCSMPECDRPADDQHHCFPRSQIGNDSWFVALVDGEGKDWPVSEWHLKRDHPDVKIIPHVTGLCRHHHTDVEEHRAWIRLEDGVFNWYDRYHSTARPEPIEDENRDFAINGYGFQLERGNGVEGCPPERGCNEWCVVGPLNPQPGSVEGKPKKRRKSAQPARNKTRLLIHVPKDAQENGTEVLETLIDGVREKLRPEFTWSETVPPYYVLCAALAQVLQT